MRTSTKRSFGSPWTVPLAAALLLLLSGCHYYHGYASHSYRGHGYHGGHGGHSHGHGHHKKRHHRGGYYHY